MTIAVDWDVKHQIKETYVDFFFNIPRPLIAVRHYLEALEDTQPISIYLNADWCQCTPEEVTVHYIYIF